MLKRMGCAQERKNRQKSKYTYKINKLRKFAYILLKILRANALRYEEHL